MSESRIQKVTAPDGTVVSFKVATTPLRASEPAGVAKHAEAAKVSVVANPDGKGASK